VILVLLIAVLFIGGVLAWVAERIDDKLPRVIALVALLIDFLLMLTLLNAGDSGDGSWLVLLKPNGCQGSEYPSSLARTV
jgi:NADH-quinone oxidoreductase subunit M